ncbi:MAG: ATP-binding protein [Gemmatimonadota bacterium]
MTRPTLPPRGSLRRTVLLGASVSVVLLLLSMSVLLQAQARMRVTLTTATDAFIEEQRIADRLLRASSLQLVAAGFAAAPRDAQVVDQFRTAGDQVYEQIRRYLFRPLSGEQRRRLEAVREQHQQLEVAAAEAFTLQESGSLADARAASAEALTYALQLQSTLDEFLALREADLEALQERQADAFASLRLAALAFGLLALAGPLLLVPFLERRLTRPLLELADAAGRVGRGEPGVRVAVARRDEVGAAARSFNRMADRLDRARQDLRTRNEELAAALHELEATQDEMVQTEKLTAVGRMMAGLAHELNNPLASVLGYGELLRKRLAEEGEPPGAEELREEYVEPLVAEARRARSLTRHLLGLARKSEDRLSRVPLDQVLEQTAALRRFSFQQAGLDLQVDVPGLSVVGEPQRIQQAFLNLVNNAYDAMAPGGAGTLRITGRSAEGRVEVAFADNGPGFGDPARAFEPFYTTKAPGQGTGLGLSLVHRFMEEFGGTARASNQPDGGACVVLCFPDSVPLDPPPGQAEEEAPPSASAAEERTADPAGGRPLRVLVVEDEAPIRELQRRFLRRLNAEVSVAASAAEARTVMERQTVDVVVSDVKMPGESGVELYRWVQRERPELAERFLFVTGDIGDAEVAALAARRPQALLHKPFLMQEYLARVSALADPG